MNQYGLIQAPSGKQTKQFVQMIEDKKVQFIVEVVCLGFFKLLELERKSRPHLHLRDGKIPTYRSGLNYNSNKYQAVTCCSISLDASLVEGPVISLLMSYRERPQEKKVKLEVKYL